MYNPVTSKLPDKNAHFRAAINTGKSVYDVDMLFGFRRPTLSGGSRFYNQASLVGGEDFYNNAALTGGAEFYNDAALRGGADFYNDAALRGGADFYNDAALRGGADFYNDAALRGGAEFYNDAALRGGAEFYNDAALRGGAEFYNDAALRGGADFYNDAALRGGADFYNDAALKGGAEFYNNAALRGGFAFPEILKQETIIAPNGDVSFLDWGRVVDSDDAKRVGHEIFLQIVHDAASRDQAVMFEWGSYEKNKRGSVLSYLSRPYPEGSDEVISDEDIEKALTLAYFSDSLKALIAINQYELNELKKIRTDGTVVDDPSYNFSHLRKPKKEYLRALKYNLSNLMRYIKDESGLEFLVERALKVMRGTYRVKTAPPPSDALKILADRHKEYKSYDTRRALRFLYRGISPFKLYVGKEESDRRRNKRIDPKRPLTTEQYRRLRYGDEGMDPRELLPPAPAAVPSAPPASSSSRSSSPPRRGRGRRVRGAARSYNLRNRP